MYRNKLLKKLESLDAHHFQLFKDLKAYSGQDLSKRPAVDVWSPLEVLEHMLISEKLSLAYCRKKLSFKPKLKKRDFRTWLNEKLVVISLKSPFKFTAPSMVNDDNFTIETTLANIEEEWLSLRTEIKSFITEVSDEYLETEVYKHPFGLRMSLGGMLDFYSAHFFRHRKQLLSRLL